MFSLHRSRASRSKNSTTSTPNDGAAPTFSDIVLPSAQQADFAETIRSMDAAGAFTSKCLHAILNDRGNSREQRFAALYGLLFRLGRDHHFDEYEALCSTYKYEFGNEPYFDTFLATIQRMRGEPASLRSALTLSERALTSLGDRPGVLHQYAIIAADLLDADPKQSAPIARLALDRVDLAMRISKRNNPNFHSTRARLLARLGDFQGAGNEIEAALRLEDTSSPDSLRRIARFEAIRTSISLLQSEANFAKVVDESRSQLASLRAEQTQLLGILAAISALIVVTITQGSRITSDVGAIRFSLIFLGGILTVFTGLFFAIQDSKNIWRLLVPLFLALGLFAFGIWGGALL